MIIDTTYLLPLVQIDVPTDLLSAITKKRINIRLKELGISSISIFELQAKAAKLFISPETVNDAIKFIMKHFRVINFYNSEIVRVSFELRKILPDYIDCVILATAIICKEDLLTEDSKIHAIKSNITRKHNIKILRFSDLMKSSNKIS